MYIREVILHAVQSDEARLPDHHTYNTRHGNLFVLHTHRLTLYKKKPSYCGAVFFNGLPHALQQLPKENLKTALTTWLLGQS
ncbi:hypothetical protein J6590_072713, partial [Homalodisca vitripennis]